MEKEKSKKGTVIIIALLTLIFIGVGSFCGFYFYKVNGSSDKPIEKAYIDIGEITVKLSDDSGKKYLKLDMSVAYDKKDSKAKNQLKKDAQLPVVRDALNFYLMSKKSDYFKGDYEKEFKEGLINAINQKIQGFEVIDIKVSNLIIQ